MIWEKLEKIKEEKFVKQIHKLKILIIKCLEICLDKNRGIRSQMNYEKWEI